MGSIDTFSLEAIISPDKFRSTSCDGQVLPCDKGADSTGSAAKCGDGGGASLGRSATLRTNSSPPTPLSSTPSLSLASNAFASTRSLSSGGFNDPQELHQRLHSYIGSSGFSSASSDSADTSLTSTSVSSTSRRQSPCMLGYGNGGPSNQHYTQSRSASGSSAWGVGGISGGSSLPSSPLSCELGASGDRASSASWTPGFAARQSLSSSITGSFFLPGPALMPDVATIPTDEPIYEDLELAPPSNFGMVAPGVYRSSFPKPENFSFLRSLRLRSVLTLVQDEYPEANRAFIDEEGIRFFRFSIPGNKEPFVHIPEDKIRVALACVLDVRNHPMLIHCNKGKHRTGCLVGCLRKMQHWSSTAIFDEYRRYAFPKSRNMDQQFIELFDQSSVWGDLDGEHAPIWLDQSA